MTKTIKHGGQLLHQSMRVVRSNKKLILLPLISSLLVLLLMALIITPIIQYEKSRIIIEKGQAHLILWTYIIFLLFLFATHQITIHFNAALSYCTKQHFKGKPVELMQGIKAANAHFLQLYNWNSFASTIGIFITLLRPALQQLKFYQNTFSGLRWIVATYFLIPVIMSEKSGPIASIKRSSELIRKTWGANLKKNFGFITLLLIARFISLLPLIIGLIMGGHRNIIIGTVLTVSLVIITTVITSATQTILACALHLYASQNIIAPEFNEALIKQAFVKIE